MTIFDGYLVQFCTVENTPIQVCQICLASSCNFCKKGYFWIISDYSKLQKLYEQLELGNIKSKKIRIYITPDIIISSLPLNTVKLEGLKYSISYPCSLKKFVATINYSSDSELISGLPNTLDEVYLDIIPRETISELLITGLPPYVKILNLQFQYSKIHSAGININGIPDSVEEIHFTLGYCEKPTYITNILRLPAQLKKISFNMPEMSCSIFEDTSRMDIEHNGMQYVASGNNCMKELKRYCIDNNVAIRTELF